MRNDYAGAPVGFDQQASDGTGCHEEVGQDQGLGHPADVRGKVVHVGGRRSPPRVGRANYHRV
eukprot:14102722-Alexandrium_andersonii.AAC.1